MDDLDAMFAAAKSDKAQPSEALMARVLADAAVHQPKQNHDRRPLAKPGFWAGLAATFGGGGALAGIGSAAAAGLFLGFVQPVDIAALTDSLGGVTVENVELMPGLDALLAGE